METSRRHRESTVPAGLYQSAEAEQVEPGREGWWARALEAKVAHGWGNWNVPQMVRDIPGESLQRRMTYKWLFIPFQSS